MNTQTKKPYATYGDLLKHLSSKLEHQPELKDIPIGEDISLFLDRESIGTYQTICEVAAVCSLMVDLCGNINTPCTPLDIEGLGILNRWMQIKLKSIDASKVLD